MLLFDMLRFASFYSSFFPLALDQISFDSTLFYEYIFHSHLYISHVFYISYNTHKHGSGHGSQ